MVFGTVALIFEDLLSTKSLKANRYIACSGGSWRMSREDFPALPDSLQWFRRFVRSLPLLTIKDLALMLNLEQSQAHDRREGSPGAGLHRYAQGHGRPGRAG